MTLVLVGDEALRRDDSLDLAGDAQSRGRSQGNGDGSSSAVCAAFKLGKPSSAFSPAATTLEFAAN